MNNFPSEMKAVILAAGVGSRIRPMTDNCPKCLLKIGENTILEMMISHIQDCGIKEVVFVIGYLQDHIINYVKTAFPDLTVHFVINEKYQETNTGYSLMLTKDYIQDATFIKFDADVVFDKAILKKLIEFETENSLCIDTQIHLDAEEVKVIVDSNNRIIKVGKSVHPQEAAGESIGIEKIGGQTAALLFAELKTMMDDDNNHQEYYEAAYERLIDKGIPIHALDITDIGWTEIDTAEDFATAESIFVSESVYG